MFAFVHFAAPALLVGITAATVPFVIHLLLRPRPRRVCFPAVTFLQAALASGKRAQRVRNLWLLAVRALLLGCVALLLAGPTCVPSAATPEADAPAACVVVMDDSWSMRYRLDADTTVLDRARAEAAKFIRSVADWPQPSAVALVWADPERPITELTSDYAEVRAHLRDVAEPVAHAAPLNHALRTSARLLQAAKPPLRRLVVFTDQAAHAWRNVAPGLLSGIDNLTVSVRSVAPARPTNIAITSGQGPTRLHPQNAPVPIEATLSAAGWGATCSLVVRDGDHVVRRVGPLTIPRDSSRDLSLALPPRPSGVHALTLEVEPDDRLGFDQRRYLVFQTTERPVAWLVTPADAGPEVDLTALLIQNLLAPESLEPSQQLVSFRHVLPAELGQTATEDADPEALEPGGREVNLIVITSGADMNEAARQRVRRAAERGAIVALLPGSRMSGNDWPGLRKLLARAIPNVEMLDAVTSFSWEAASAFARRSETVDEMTEAAVRRRIVLAGLEDGVAVEARYADDLPAVVSLPRGRGRFVLLTTSPDPEWSELGMRAAGLLTWLHDLLGETLGSPDAVATFDSGEETRHSFAGLPGRGVARVTSLTAPGDKSVPVRLSNAEPTPGWPTRQPGVYAVRTVQRDDRETRYAVNWPPEESDLTPLAEDRLAALLGVEEVALESVDPAPDSGESTLLARLMGLNDAARVLPFVLLALILGELLLASRARGLDESG